MSNVLSFCVTTDLQYELKEENTKQEFNIRCGGMKWRRDELTLNQVVYMNCYCDAEWFLSFTLRLSFLFRKEKFAPRPQNS